MIEVKPGGIVNLGQIFETELLQTVAGQLRASRETSVQRPGEFRYWIASNAAAAGYISVDASIQKNLEDIYALMMSSMTPARSDVSLREYCTFGALILDDKLPELGWHIDNDRTVRIVTNLGRATTTLSYATLKEAPEIGKIPMPGYTPRAFRTLDIAPWASYVINNMTAPEHQTRHNTPPEPDRLMLMMYCNSVGSDTYDAVPCEPGSSAPGGCSLQIDIPAEGIYRAVQARRPRPVMAWSRE